MLAGSMAGYAVMMKQQHGAERRMEEAMAESITITCRRDEETEPCSSRARLPCFTCCRHFSSLIRYSAAIRNTPLPAPRSRSQ